MKPLRINEGAWHSYKANLNFIATSVLAFGVMVGQTDSGSGDLAYDILPIAQFESTSESNEFEEYIGSVDGSGNDLGKWLSSLFVKLKLMQITGMRLIGLTISSTLSNFDLCSEKFLKHLEKILDFMPRQKELRVLVLDSEDSAVKQALTIDFESRKARADEFVLEHEDIDLKILVKTQLTISSMSVVSSNSKQTDSEILNEQIRAYSSRITGFIAAHAGVILSSSQSLECIQGLGRYIDEVHLDLYGDEQGAKFENKSAECADQESKKITIDGTFELRCYVSLKATVFEILSLLAKDFVDSFNKRIELASWENNDFDSSAGKLNKNKTFGFNLARRGFLRVEAHPYVLYQDYLTGTEVERDSRRRISRNTSVYAEVLGDFEVNKLVLTGKGVPRKLIVMQEVKQDKRIFEQLTAIKTQSVKQFKAFTGKTLQDPSDLMKRFLFAGLALASLATFRSIYLDHYVDFI